MDRNPLEMALAEGLLTPERAAELAAAVDPVLPARQALPPRVFWGDLKAPVYGDDPTELIKNRFLYKGGMGLVCGPTGIGKSAFVAQMMTHFAAGRGLFGIEPGGHYAKNSMRIMLVQAENDEGDLAEMRDGVERGSAELTPEENALARRRIAVVTVNDKSSDEFADTLDDCLKEYGKEDGAYDLVIADPAFAYLGGDSNSQKDVSRFMRELMNPLVQRHQVGLFFVHHVNKPPSGVQKSVWTAGDFAYLGSGSAEWINPARCALAFRSIGSHDVFELIAAKRGKRLRWKDREGKPTCVKCVAHSPDEGVICWHEADAAEEAAARGGSAGLAAGVSAGSGSRPPVNEPKYDPRIAVRLVQMEPGLSENQYRVKLEALTKCSRTKARELLVEAEDAGWLTSREVNRCRRYSVTPEGLAEVGEAPF